MTTPAPTFDAIRALDAEHVMQTYGRLPVAFVRGEGVRLWDADGREYLDFLGGLAVTSLGHAHPAVADALAEQASTLLHVSNLYYNELQPQLAAPARRPASAAAAGCSSPTPGPRRTSARSSSPAGTARANGGPERYHVVSAYGSFHGRTLTTLAATGQPQKQETFQPLPSGFRQVPFADVDALVRRDRRAGLRGDARGDPGRGRRATRRRPATSQQVRRLCDEREALLIVDEVQTGLGRTGRWFGFEHADGVRPDVVTMAKALGNGVPIGACWARADVAAAFRPGDHATTFGGQPLAAAAALAVLDVMEAEDVPARAARAGERLTKALARRAAASPTSAAPGLLRGGRARAGAGGRRRRGRVPRARASS